MDPLRVFFERSFLQLGFEEIFNGFDIMVGGSFYFLYVFRVSEREIRVPGAELFPQ